MSDAGTSRLEPCPRSPNCVSSHAEAGSRSHVEPLRFDGPPEAAWAALERALDAMPRTVVVEDDGRFLHAECRTRLLRFVDDLHAELSPADGRIDVRSASRVGWSDLGVNRRRVESLRKAFRTELAAALPSPAG